MLTNIPNGGSLGAGGGGGGTEPIEQISYLFGAGSDGAVTLTAGQSFSLPQWLDTSDFITFHMIRDANPTTLTIGSGVTLYTHGYAIVATTSITNAGTIDGRGENAIGSDPGYLDQNLYTVVPADTSFVSPTPSLGKPGAGSINASSGYEAGYWADDACFAGGAGGGGGSGNAGAGNGTNGSTPAAGPFRALWRSPTYPGGNRLVSGDDGTTYGVSGGAGGGGGGWNGVSEGGGGGQGGCYLELSAPTVTNTGTITVAGGNGAAGPGSGCGGGGGGGGGIIFIVYTSAYTNSGTISVAGGNGGSGNGTGTAGQSGESGVVVELQL